MLLNDDQTVAFALGCISAGASHHQVSAINTSDGSSIWQTPIPDTMLGFEQHITGLSRGDGKIVLSLWHLEILRTGNATRHRRGNSFSGDVVWCLDEATGTVLWSAPGGGHTEGQYSIPIVYKGTVIVTIGFATMKLNASTGELILANHHAFFVTNTRPLLTEHYAIGPLLWLSHEVDEAPYLAAMDLDTLDVVWNVTAPRGSRVWPALSSTQAQPVVMYPGVFGANRQLSALSAIDGRSVWNASLNGATSMYSIQYIAPSDIAESVYIGLADAGNSTVILNLTNGATIAVVSLPEPAMHAGAVVDGVLYVPSGDTVWSLQPGAPEFSRCISFPDALNIGPVSSANGDGDLLVEVQWSSAATVVAFRC